MTDEQLRPTKRQRDILVYIDTFITEHGYSPSYREIMQGLNYTSVATVALHVNSLIKRGHIKKRDHEARSLEVVGSTEQTKLKTNKISEAQEKWLVEKVEHFFDTAEQNSGLQAGQIDQLYVLLGTLKILGIDGAAQSFMPRLSLLNKKATKK